MDVATRPLHERFSTELALVGLLTRVGPFVGLHVALLDKALVAVTALVPLVFQVDLLVTLLCVDPLELLATELAPALAGPLMVSLVLHCILLPHLLVADVTLKVLGNGHIFLFLEETVVERLLRTTYFLQFNGVVTEYNGYY